MKIYNLELTAPELVKLVSICNGAIVSEQEILRNLSAYNHKVKTMSENSIEMIWQIKNKVKRAINDEYGSRITEGTDE